MKQINTYINEKLRLTTKRQYTCQPKKKSELRKIILQRIKDEGNECDLNDIDTSKITDMSWLFYAGTPYNGGNPVFENFNGNISMWDVSNVTDMHCMFRECKKFNCDISKWNVLNVIDMGLMFYGCKKFNKDLSQWDVSNVTDMYGMFYGCNQFNCNLSGWNVSKVEDILGMFYRCKTFNQDLNSWDVSNVKDMDNAFKYCPTQPKWYK